MTGMTAPEILTRIAELTDEINRLTGDLVAMIMQKEEE